MASPVNHDAVLLVDGARSERAWSWPTPCLLCAESAVPGKELCSPCGDALPWNHRACRRCALPLPTPAPACGACLQRPPPLTETHAAFVYGIPLDRLLLLFKFKGDLRADACWRDAGTGEAGAPRPDALIPIPLLARVCARVARSAWNGAALPGNDA